MRLVQLAKALGMTGQQLRKELETVNFGIKPTDREIPDNLAQGVLRYVAKKHGITVDLTGLGANFMDQEGGMGGEENGQVPSAAAAAPANPVNEILQKESEKVASRQEALHVLRKLTLDDVPREAIKRQQKQLTKEEIEERKREEKAQPSRRGSALTPEMQQQIKKKDGKVTLPAQITVKEFAEKAGVQVPKIIQALLKNGILATITQSIDYDTAAIVAAELGVQVDREHTAAKVEDLLSKNLEELIKDEPENLITRPPIVVVMGHVDHGKTSILDAIRSTDVVAKESGGITQHIGAYQVTYNDKQITFLDTPGHEAFTAMRARGAQVTDIAILVVSAEEGIKATTIEAINHAKEAGVPIIVAINKIDRPNAEPDRVKGELASQGLQPEEWGGETPMIHTSAVTKEGIPELLDHILMAAELENLKANPKRKAIATVIESHLDPSLGPLATVIVNTGTLKVGDAFICGRVVGKVRAMSDAHGKKLADVPPSGPVRVSGFDGVPHTGDILQVMGTEREARDMHKKVLDTMGAMQKRGFADLVSRLHEGKLPALKIVVKADTQGSLEAIQAMLDKQITDKVQVKVIHGAIGAVTESDAMMAAASDALVMAFRVPVPGPVQRTADREGVQVREYDIIYKLLEEVEGLLLGLLVPEELEKIFGHLEVKGVFLTKKSEQVIGGRVLDGVIKRVTFRIKRDEEIVGTGRITSLRKVDQDIKEAKEGTECGMRTEASLPLEVGDVLEAYTREFKKKD